MSALTSCTEFALIEFLAQFRQTSPTPRDGDIKAFRPSIIKAFPLCRKEIVGNVAGGGRSAYLTTPFSTRLPSFFSASSFRTAPSPSSLALHRPIYLLPQLLEHSNARLRQQIKHRDERRAGDLAGDVGVFSVPLVMLLQSVLLFPSSFVPSPYPLPLHPAPSRLVVSLLASPLLPRTLPFIVDPFLSPLVSLTSRPLSPTSHLSCGRVPGMRTRAARFKAPARPLGVVRVP
ncbi:hypothetical protein K438DRAFT_2026602 [Mycena galopus ATCC 62051]|nr:hypothetical protein K438DRAFT_2026602 [Mycena galopus ATCC 62051]